MALLPVAEALAQVLAPARTLPAENVALAQARGRVLAAPITALRTQPGFAASAMDGYAVRAADASAGATLRLIGESAAGHGFAGRLEAGEALRIFTGAPVPAGADAVVIQENTRREGDLVVIETAAQSGQHIRGAGLDFRSGDAALLPGLRLGPRDLALAAAMNHAALPVTRRPKVAVLATGDELVSPGGEVGPDQIVTSNSWAIAALAEAEGAEVFDLGIARDTMESLDAAFGRARNLGADILVTIGGASVGDHDLVQKALRAAGMQPGFWKIAMRPGKPLMHGALGETHVLGLPGNPVSAVVCGVLFLVPLIRALLGRADVNLPRRRARLARPWPANDLREDYLRATLTLDEEGGLPDVAPFALQDSSLVSVLQQADCLVVRPPFAPASAAGEVCEIIDLRQAGL